MSCTVPKLPSGVTSAVVECTSSGGSSNGWQYVIAAAIAATALALTTILTLRANRKSNERTLALQLEVSQANTRSQREIARDDRLFEKRVSLYSAILNGIARHMNPIHGSPTLIVEVNPIRIKKQTRLMLEFIAENESAITIFAGEVVRNAYFNYETKIMRLTTAAMRVERSEQETEDEPGNIQQLLDAMFTLSLEESRALYELRKAFQDELQSDL